MTNNVLFSAPDRLHELRVWMRRTSATVVLIAFGACTATNTVGNTTTLDLSGATTGDAATDYSGLDVEPSALQTITVAAGTTTPTVAYMATLLGTPVTVRWSVDRGNIGSVDQSEGSAVSFAPRGTTGGLVNVIASIGSTTIKRQVMVKLTTAPQNGMNASIVSEQAQVPANVAALKSGGGVGGVGGEGIGVAVSNASTMTSLASPVGDGSAEHLVFLYPYNQTVWPRGMLAPLLMWKWDTGDADAIQIDLSTTSGSFSWTGIFGRPAILSQTGANFIRHPIPQDVWEMATNSAGGPTPDGTTDKLTIKLTLAKSGQAYGPISETWGVAPGRLTGTVYYQGYGTQLVTNSGSTDVAGHPYGVGILSIRSGDTGPKLAVGSATSGCRACHVVASRGHWLISQEANYAHSYVYNLQPPLGTTIQATEKALSPDGSFGWAGMVSNGSYALTNAVDDGPGNYMITNAKNGNATSSFWQFGGTVTPATATGLPSQLAAAYPIFSPDDKYIAYIDVTGHTTDVSGPLMVGSYDASSFAFGSAQALYAPTLGARLGFPSFLPDNSGIVFENETRTSFECTHFSEYVMTTYAGARGELWWTNTGSSPVAVPLKALNGKSANGQSYLPIAGNNHGITDVHPGSSDPMDTYDETGYDDTTLDYEPTVAPIVAGGYAWVVFTSRRLYGNMLTSLPWESHPQYYDLTDLSQATVKKLWLAAIDLNAPPGSDPSHAAFYLPAQEILAANLHAYWALDPCQADGNTCDTGDQCCGGCCQPNGAGGALICQSPPADGYCSGVGHCSAVQEKCTTSADCCDGTNSCVNGFCAYVIQ